ncbi:SusC/RagA family TonB-linked outer membrane protein [Maribellus comscasis]|uniref:SusC/RagA family TonB-linked outer membrane protein n=2 Tax=Maribellus comscasis TaxID=2681766 RepID=A0A6I6K3M1_9BACT|nr:SusC/RagA family TonB-linked outer membrane protein [Maribellus comscasis]
MRLTIFLILVSVFASTASVYSQATKLTVKMKDRRIAEVFDAIEQQSEFYFFYNRDNFNDNNLVSVDMEGKTIEQILNQLFKGQAVTYEIVNRNILIKTKSSYPGISEIQQEAVSGKVTDTRGQPLPGVTVLVKGTSQGTVTTTDGEYSISNIAENAVLVFSFVGMKSREVVVGNQTRIDIVLEEEAIGLDEVVAIGYGTQKKRDLTAAISTVGAEELSNRPITNSTQTLQGTKGIYVNQLGAQPGRSDASIRIRGLGTLNNNNPLVLVDGVEFSLSDVNPNDIESISVLKDAAAAAIYGSRAASGVILVTTKSGERTKGFHINYNNYFGMEKVIGLPNFITDPVRVLELTNLAKLNAGQNPWYSDEMIEEYRQGMETDPIVYPHNDWFDIMFDTGFIQNHNVRFTGGADNYNFSLSLGYQDHNGALMGTTSDKYSIALNSRANITDRLSIGIIFNGQLNVFDEALAGTPYLMNTVFKNAGLGYEPTYTADGKYANHWFITPGHYQFRNPIAVATEGINNHRNEHYYFILDAQYELPGNFTYKVKGSYAKENNLNTQFEPLVYQYDAKTGASKTILIADASVRRASKSIVNNYDLNFNQTLNWNKEIENHVINALVGYEVKEFNYNNLYGYIEGFLGNGLTTLNAGSTGPQTTGTNSRNSLMSFFGRLEYNYNSKYLFQGNFRYDGSSRFAEGRKWGLFPSFSAGWRIGQENFMENISWLDDLKIRGSWGQLGNERVPSFRYVNLVNLGYDYSFGSTIEPGAAIAMYNDPTLTWETSTTSNIGVDAYLLNNSLNFSVELFKKRTSDILHNVSIPTQVGDLTGPIKNIGVVDNKGYEFDLSYRNKIGSVSYEVSGSITRIKNNVVDLNGEVVYEYGSRSQGGTIIKEGYPIQSYYLLHAIGIFDTQEEIDNSPFQTEDTKPGYIKFEDANNDGVINQDDRIILDKNRIPDYTASFNLSLTYKNINVSAFFNGVKGVYTFRAQPGDVPFWYGTGVTEKWITDSWTTDNMDAKLPILTTYEDAVNTNFRSSDFLLQDASYLRLKNLQVSYNLPAHITDMVKVNSAKIFVNAENLWTLTKMDTFDPERGMETDNAYYDYPSVKTFTCGIEIDF